MGRKCQVSFFTCKKSAWWSFWWVDNKNFQNKNTFERS